MAGLVFSLAISHLLFAQVRASDFAQTPEA